MKPEYTLDSPTAGWKTVYSDGNIPAQFLNKSTDTAKPNYPFNENKCPKGAENPTRDLGSWGKWRTNVLSLSLQGLMRTQQENGSHTMKYKSKYKEKKGLEKNKRLKDEKIKTYPVKNLNTDIT